MLIKLAWRNIWRNSRRSLIVLISIIVGIVAAVLFDALSVGMIFQMLDNQVGTFVSHIQIHKKGFNSNKLLQNYLPDADAVVDAISRQPAIAASTRRIISYGIISSATSSSGVSLVGIEPETEAQVTDLKNSTTAGIYPTGEGREILIGRKLAEKLDVGVGDKVVAMASRLDGSIGSDVFRVSGLFETFNSNFDKSTVYISLKNAQEMLALGDHFSEFALLMRDIGKTGQVHTGLLSTLNIAKKPPVYEVLSYRELLPLLVMQVDVYRQSMSIFYGIVALAMLFGIINTMLMSVLERTPEFGVLMAMGMKNGKIFRMVILEAFLLGALGTIIGFAISYLIYLPLSSSGIDLSAYATGLNAFGAGSVIYPVITTEGVLNALLIVPIAAVLGAIYPALKATRLEPIEAIRQV